MNYKCIYKQLCDRGQKRKYSKGEYEKHHIIPTFFFKNNKRKLRYNDGILEGDPDAIENISLLTPREHFIAHLLLHKIYYKTKWSYRCLTSLLLFFNKIGNKHATRNLFSISGSKKYQAIQSKIRKSLSDEKKGKMIVKDAITGERYGWQLKTHPKVLSGEWVFFHKGIKRSPEAMKNRASYRGINNSNYFHELNEDMIKNELMDIWNNKEKYPNCLIEIDPKCYIITNFIFNYIVGNIKKITNRKKLSSVALSNRGFNLEYFINFFNSIQTEILIKRDKYWNQKYVKN